ncbi:hypothetical protein JUJ52_21350 [Virgibacillus sp. AGTR]|uniref:PD-(D/E)XK nuclease superfamily protein n=1 Tax=Virgibacillus salarius TaxID=447199 RepID=A0A941DTA2_9BACI|nr:MULTISPECIES: hypothetical protein [Virgibacillus]NAZ07701.1 hypothetical protein [Agaribacter marinus]MBR7794981.1 hypothetical protein [Virgibacillus salarius]MCC2252482.1 hypothetical protein [Virgibacillus sp. AGTR]MDY7046082.1 hypothetical protein [Virgibacillus sp. M23]QRZ18736.1 hypothetical protein JUJ52_03035 [Virgibacillus sp. AGTR]
MKHTLDAANTNSLNIFDALNCFYQKDVIANMFATFINYSSEFALQFLRDFSTLHVEINANTEVRARSRMALGKSMGIIDLVLLVVEDNQINHIVVIENILNPDENGKHTECLQTDTALENLCTKLGVDHTTVFVDYVILTLDPFGKDQVKNIHIVDYRTFLQDIWANLFTNESLKQLFLNFQEMLERFYYVADMSLEEHAITLLANPDLDEQQRHLLFKKLICQINVAEQDVIEMDALQGAEEFKAIARIAKPEWVIEYGHVYLECVLDLLHPFEQNGEIAFLIYVYYQANSKRKFPEVNEIRDWMHQLVSEEKEILPQMHVDKLHTSRAVVQISFADIHTFNDLKDLLEYSMEWLTPIIVKTFGKVSEKNVIHRN